jgi:1-acyl-sn-glycerol-3-phosphate acyltransferase
MTAAIPTSSPAKQTVQATAANDFPAPYPVQFKGSALARALLRLFGWNLHFHGLPSRQGVIVIYPHTSNWDFVVGIMAKWALGVQLHFWGKDSLFKVPLFGRWLRWLGGIPVVRNASSGIVDTAVASFKQAQQDDAYLWVALAPEGTRRKTEGWRSGFYQTVVRAEVPLGLAHLDFVNKRVTLLDFMSLTGDHAHDMARVQNVYAQTQGKRASQASPVVLLAPRNPSNSSVST